MSRTSIHRPGWVRYFDDSRAVREHHDHSSGPCDLPSLDAWAAAARPGGWNPAWGKRRCSFDVEIWATSCGCGMCTARDERRQDRRRQRHGARAAVRRAAWRADEP